MWFQETEWKRAFDTDDFNNFLARRLIRLRAREHPEEQLSCRVLESLKEANVSIPGQTSTPEVLHQNEFRHSNGWVILSNEFKLAPVISLSCFRPAKQKVRILKHYHKFESVVKVWVSRHIWIVEQIIHSSWNALRIT